MIRNVALTAWSSLTHNNISERLIEEFAAIGDENAIHKKIDEYRAAGVSLPAVGMFSGPKGSGLDPNATLEAAIG